MVAASDAPTPTPTNGTGRPIGRMGARLAGGLVLWLRSRNTRHELMRLSDRALEDIGTTRADIPRFARRGDPWRRLPGEAAFVVALGGLIERLESWRERRRRQIRIYRELMAYSDRELNEIGLSRRDVPEIARMA